jgi:hypothetical protein
MEGEKLKIPARSVFAGLLLWADSSSSALGRTEADPAVELTNKLVRLEEEVDLDTSEISIRADRGGWISDDLASFVDRLLLFGLVRERPRLVLLPRGRDLCNDILMKDSGNYSTAIDKLKLVLGLAEQHSGPKTAPPDSMTA